jgi:hypothetical protein
MYFVLRSIIIAAAAPHREAAEKETPFVCIIPTAKQ